MYTLNAAAPATIAVAHASNAVPIAGCQPAPNRAPQIFKEVTKVPGAPGKVSEVIRRLPTPTADVIDRTIIEFPGQDTVNVIYERPTTPPPNLVERRLVEAPPPAQVNCFERTVPHRPRETVIHESAPVAAFAAAPVVVAASHPAAYTVTAAHSSAYAIAGAGPCGPVSVAHVASPLRLMSSHLLASPVCASPVVTRVVATAPVFQRNVVRQVGPCDRVFFC